MHCMGCHKEIHESHLYCDDCRPKSFQEVLIGKDKHLDNLNTIIRTIFLSIFTLIVTLAVSWVVLIMGASIYWIGDKYSYVLLYGSILYFIIYALVFYVLMKLAYLSKYYLILFTVGSWTIPLIFLWNW